MGENKARNAARVIIYAHRLRTGCVWCGERRLALLQSDHIDPTKKRFRLADFNGRTEACVRSELAKTRTLCIRCHTIATSRDQAKWVGRRRRRAGLSPRMAALYTFVQDTKVARGCEQCGYTNRYHPETLVFDHRVRSSKHADVSDMMTSGYALDTIRGEIKKCRVLCQSCHMVWTRQQCGWPDESDIERAAAEYLATWP